MLGKRLTDIEESLWGTTGRTYVINKQNPRMKARQG
ncbi:ribosomal protein bL36 [Citricoccus nitrophenolicus]